MKKRKLNSGKPTPKKRGRGRPPLSPELVKSFMIRVRVTEAELKILSDKATKGGVSLSEMLLNPHLGK